MMYARLFGVLLLIGLCCCADDENLNAIVSLLNNSEARCSQFLDSSTNTTSPLYLHWKYPVLLKIFNEQSLSKHYNKEIASIELLIGLIEGYLFQAAKDNVHNRGTDYRQNVRRLFSSFKRSHSSVTLIGLCLKDQFIDSETDQVNHYLCKQEATFLDSARKWKKINNITYSMVWEPTTCSVTNDVVNFPIRLIYHSQLFENSSMLIYFEFNARQFTLNQCDTELHRCKEETTKCIYNLFSDRQHFTTGNYFCQCRRGFFMGHLDGNSQGFPGYRVEKEFLEYDENNPFKSEYFNYNCQTCKPGCETCTNNDPCIVISDSILLRGLPLAFQSFCITLCIVTGIIVFQLRHTRVIKSSNWILLELFLLGAISIYSMVINSFFFPAEVTCAIQPFLRECGFVLMYGVLYVKVYRVLCSFQSRKAQRAYVRDRDILRYLGVLVIICFGHLIAWVATSFDHKRTSGYTPFSEIVTMEGNISHMRSTSCRSKFWDVISYLYETGLLAITIYYCKCIKSAPSEYGEVRFITIAVVNELIFSLIVIILRMSIAGSVYPDHIFIIHFVHCHITTTISVVLLLGPKLWYLYRPPILADGRPRLIPHSETHIIQTQQKLNGDVDLAEINLAEMDSETIREELKRLYTQLEIYKTRAMRKDNPHVSRKRGGRKQRRFSLQHFHKKHHTTSGHDDETSKISEDSGGNSAGEDPNLTCTSTK